MTDSTYQEWKKLTDQQKEVIRETFDPRYFDMGTYDPAEDHTPTEETTPKT